VDSKAASAELQSWLEHDLTPRLARAARLGLADPRRLVRLERDLRELIRVEEREPTRAKAA
jgi:hypothetical protein